MELFGNVLLPMPFQVWSIVELLISIMVVILIVRIIIRVLHKGSYCHREGRYCTQDGTTAQARRILDERYAKGEISDEEYRQKKDNLR